MNFKEKYSMSHLKNTFHKDINTPFKKITYTHHHIDIQG